jgi:hypothetical protein
MYDTAMALSPDELLRGAYGGSIARETCAALDSVITCGHSEQDVVSIDAAACNAVCNSVLIATGWFCRSRLVTHVLPRATIAAVTRLDSARIKDVGQDS